MPAPRGRPTDRTPGVVPRNAPRWLAWGPLSMLCSPCSVCGFRFDHDLVSVLAVRQRADETCRSVWGFRRCFTDRLAGARDLEGNPRLRAEALGFDRVGAHERSLGPCVGPHR